MKISGITNRVNIGFIKSTMAGIAFSILMGLFAHLTALASMGITLHTQQEPARPSDVVDKIKLAADIPIKFTNPNDAPLVITDARVKAIKLKGSGEKAKDKDFRTDQYIIKPTVTLLNKGDKRIFLFIMQFENTQSMWKGAVVNQPDKPIEINKSLTDSNPFFKQTGDISALTAMIVGIKFEDGSSWGNETWHPTGADAPKIVRISASKLESVVIKRVSPTYPEEAKKSGLSGAVSISVIIDEEGNVTSARASSGPPVLQEAAVQAVRQWKFKPMTLSDVPVKLIGTITMNFKR